MNETTRIISLPEGAFFVFRIAMESTIVRLVFAALLAALMLMHQLTVPGVVGAAYISMVIAPGGAIQRHILRLRQEGYDVSLMPVGFLIYAGMVTLASAMMLYGYYHS